MDKKSKKIFSICFIISFIIAFAFGFYFSFVGFEKNIDGFIIKKDVLLRYEGNKEEVEVPDSVTEIASDAFSSDMGYGENLKKVVVNGNVKIIKTNAFAFTAADYIYINEGVEEIEVGAFSDSYITEIHFPSSLKKIGGNIMETEEGLSGTKIFVNKGSYVENYFKSYKPYGECKVMVNE